MPVFGIAEAGFAFSAVLFALAETGHISGTRESLENLDLLVRNGQIRLCYVYGGLGDYAGLTDGNSAWVSVLDQSGNEIPIHETALVHEIIHHMVGRLCLVRLLNKCSQDPGHEASDMWGVDSVEMRAENIWRVGRY